VTATLAEFLLARYAEDEAELSDFEKSPHTVDCGTSQGYWANDPHRNGEGCRWPARVLAECEAKRRIVELLSWEGPKDGLRNRVFGPAADTAFRIGVSTALRLLALPYADHPEYRQEWAP
jgi:hypothetical protein